MKTKKKKTYEYIAFFEANEHAGYTVTVPSLPGLVTEGKDLDHARLMAKDAIHRYIEGLRKRKNQSQLSAVQRRSRFPLSHRQRIRSHDVLQRAYSLLFLRSSFATTAET